MHELRPKGRAFGREVCYDRSNEERLEWGHRRDLNLTYEGWFIDDSGTPYRLSLSPCPAIGCVNDWLVKACLWVKACRSSEEMVAALK